MLIKILHLVYITKEKMLGDYLSFMFFVEFSNSHILVILRYLRFIFPLSMSTILDEKFHCNVAIYFTQESPCCTENNALSFIPFLILCYLLKLMFLRLSHI